MSLDCIDPLPPKKVRVTLDLEVAVLQLEACPVRRALMCHKIQKNIARGKAKTITEFALLLHRDMLEAEARMRTAVEKVKNIEAQIIFTEKVLNGEIKLGEVMMQSDVDALVALTKRAGPSPGAPACG